MFLTEKLQANNSSVSFCSLAALRKLHILKVVFKPVANKNLIIIVDDKNICDSLVTI
jgi:hypothetical protein